MEKVIITGITSFLGSNLARKLVENRCEVWGIVRPNSINTSSLKDIKGIHIIKVDLDSCEDGFDLYKVMNSSIGDKLDKWIHFSWDGVGSEGRSNPEIQQKNIDNAKKAFKAAELFQTKRFIFSGSQAEYGNGNRDNPQPCSEYGKAKYKFGKWANMQNTTMEYVHLRIYSIYGIGDHMGSLVNSCIRAFKEDEAMELGPCTQTWNYMDVRDCVEAISLIVIRQTKTIGVFDIASCSEMKLKNYVEIIWSICGKKGKCIFGARGNNAEGASDLKADISRLNEIGFVEKYTFEDGIRNLIENGD